MTPMAAKKRRRSQRKGSSPLFRHVGLALKVLRELAGVSQAELSRRAGMGKGQLCKYETGKEMPKLESMEKVLAALRVSPLRLFYAMHLLSRLEEGKAPDLLLRETEPGAGTTHAGEGGLPLEERLLRLWRNGREERG
jgi:transcriptional regulator with XRE-family HTH domain